MYPIKTLSQIKRDLRRMKKYGFKAIRVTGHELLWLTKIIKEAKKVRLEVWLCPRFAHSKPMLSKEEYFKEVRKFANEAEKLDIDIFMIGNELSLELRDFAKIQGYENRSEHWTLFEEQFRERKLDFKGYLKSLVRETRKIFSGPITYAAGQWELKAIDWSIFDIIAVNLYLWKQFKEKEYIKTLKKLKKYAKPVVVTEFGFTTTKEAWEIGPRHIYGMRKIPFRDILLSHPTLVRKIIKFGMNILLKTKIPHHYDEEMQKQLLNKNLRILNDLKIRKAFVFQWSEPWEAGFGLIRKNGKPKKALLLLSKAKH